MCDSYCLKRPIFYNSSIKLKCQAYLNTHNRNSHKGPASSYYRTCRHAHANIPTCRRKTVFPIFFFNHHPYLHGPTGIQNSWKSFSHTKKVQCIPPLLFLCAYIPWPTPWQGSSILSNACGCAWKIIWSPLPGLYESS